MSSSTMLRIPNSEMDNRVQVFTKRIWELGPGGLRSSRPGRLSEEPEALGAVVAGNDFAPRRVRTDVAVHGHAYAPGGSPVSRFSCSLSVGRRQYRACVFGPRLARWTSSGRALIEAPAALDRCSLGAERAYGGVDERGLASVSADSLDELTWNTALSGAFYPRNMRGLGYCLGRSAELSLPQLEDPEHLITQDRLVVEPESWWQRPIPRHFGAVLPCEFPRTLLACEGAARGVSRPPSVELPEVERGWLAPEDFDDGQLDRFGIAGRFFQDAPLGLQFRFLQPGAPIILENMHREHVQLKFEVPSPPQLDLELKGTKVGHCPLVLHRVVISPDSGEVAFTYFCEAELPHYVAPTVQPDIPLYAVVGGDRVSYVPPPKVMEARDRLRSLIS